MGPTTDTPNHPSTTARNRWFISLSVLWIGAVFYHYFFKGRPVHFLFLQGFALDFRNMDPRKFQTNCLHSLWILLVSSAIFLTLWRWGRVLSGWLRPGLGEGILRFCGEAALGILFFNGVWLALGLNGLWVRSLVLPAALLFLVWALRDFFRDPAGPGWAGRESPGGMPRLLGWAGALFLVFSIFQAFVPEVFYDAVVYHLSTLQFWMDRHGIREFGGDLYSHYPFGAELAFLNGYFFLGGEGAKMVNVFLASLLALSAAGWAAEAGGSSKGRLAWAMVWTLPLVSMDVWSAQNDAALALFLLLFFHSLSDRKGRSGWREGLFPGIWAGAALAVKYNAVLGILAGLTALAASDFPAFRRERLRAWLAGSAAAGLLFFPWFLKNWIYTGNGAYPYLSDWMGGIRLPARGLSRLMSDHQAGLFGGSAPADWLGRVAVSGLDAASGPLLFAFIPFLLFFFTSRPAVKFLSVLCGAYLLLGFAVSTQPRLMIPAFVCCFVLMESVLRDAPKSSRAAVLWACVVLAFGSWSFVNLARLSGDFYRSGKIWMGVETQEEYLANSPQVSSYNNLARMAGDLLRPGERLLVAGDARGLYYPVPFLTNTVFDEQVLAGLAEREKDGRAIWRRLLQMGVDDLAVSGEEGIRTAREFGTYPLSREGWSRLDEFIQTYTDPVYLYRTNGIYRLRSEAVRRDEKIPDLLMLFR